MKKFALLGHDIEYSLSPTIHNFVFKELKIDASYSLLSMTDDELKNDNARLFDLDGFNVTKPHKEHITDLIENCSLKAVNTVKNKNGKLSGYSTDEYGFVSDLTLNENSFYGDRVLILGAGGSAYSIAAALKKLDADVYVYNRTWEKAEELANITGITPLSTVEGFVPDAVVNCTTLGLNGENSLPYDLNIKSVKWAYDLIYNTFTPFYKTFHQKGARSYTGLGMLIFQALKSDEIFLDVSFTKEEEKAMYKKLYIKLISKK